METKTNIEDPVADKNNTLQLNIFKEGTKQTAAASTSSSHLPFYHDKHVAYISELIAKLDAKSSYEGAVTEHLRMSGVYWTFAALMLLVPEDADVNVILGVLDGAAETKRETTIVDWVVQCFDAKTGGFGGNVGHDAHLLYTLSAIQILVMASVDLKTTIDIPKVRQFVKSLQQPDGSFAGDQWGEIDTRFTYCALSTLSLLQHSDGIAMKAVIDLDQAVEYIASCQNMDGGFGSMKGAESHAGQVFCCVGALSIAKALDKIQRPDLLGWWLAERQVDSGGLNGRPEKQADVCYSWWILSVMSIMGRMDWISRDKLATFIVKAQDPDDGGIADRPEDMPDIFHTFFGIAGLSLLGKLPKNDGMYRQIDPVYALPVDVVLRCGLTGQVMKGSGRGIDGPNAVEERLRHYDILNL
jgi:geranylgeranyl transferase type-2 subunit beta